MTKEEYKKIRDGLIWIIEEGESKDTAKATASLLELEKAWRQTQLLDELDTDETEELEEEDYDEEDYGYEGAGDC